MIPSALSPVHCFPSQFPPRYVTHSLYLNPTLARLHSKNAPLLEVQYYYYLDSVTLYTTEPYLVGLHLWPFYFLLPAAISNSKHAEVACHPLRERDTIIYSLPLWSPGSCSFGTTRLSLSFSITGASCCDSTRSSTALLVVLAPPRQPLP